MVRHLESCSCNAYEISELARDGPSLSANELGGAIYPTVSLTNHSCFPNTMRYNSGSACVVRASRTIQKGEEVVDNYGHYYQMAGKKERREGLAKQYFFRCECKACKEDWPQLPRLKELHDVLLCPSCCAGIEVSSSAAAAKNKTKKCEKCKKEVKLEKRMRQMEEADRYARKALGEIGPENASQYREHLIDVLQGMEKSLKMPNIKFVYCQQVLANSFSVEGNYRVREDPTEK